MNRRLKRSVAEAGRAAAELQAGEEKYRLLTETMLDVVWTADAETLRFCYVSPSVERLLGYTPAELIGTPLLGALDPAIADEVKTVIRKGVDTFLSLSPGTPVFRTDEFRLPSKHGDGVWVEVLSTCCRNPASGVLELHGVARDISERRASQARIAHMAQHDMLTELPNRAVVSDRLSQALAAARRNGHRVGLLYIDLDRFKPVNDAYGMRWATSCCVRRRSACAAACANRTPWRASVATSSSCCCPSSTPLPMRPPSPRRSARPSPLPSTWPACGSRCRPASESRYTPTTAPTRPR